jgi:hypothetical protein
MSQNEANVAYMVRRTDTWAGCSILADSPLSACREFFRYPWSEGATSLEVRPIFPADGEPRVLTFALGNDGFYQT